MVEGSFKRKLTAVFSADVVGYSRLMGEDEAATVKTLETYKGVMSELIRQHRGRVVDSPGDNVLAEFASVVDAVQCGVAAQNEFKARNAELPENRRMQFRIGINLGDVIEEGERIYGDGVNIAARLESLAEAGGICVSKTAFDHIETKLPLGYQFLGEQTVKNIAKPVGAYKVLMEPRVTVKAEDEAKAKAEAELKAKEGARRRPLVLSAVVAGVVVLIGALAVWQFALAPKPRAVEKADPKKMALPLPDRPSIAVLPFANMTGDASQEFLVDGLTENLITALARVPQLFVIARNSTFTYKGKPVKVQQVAEELGIQYVLEGSVQRSGDKVRITAQFIDAVNGRHLWAAQYDRDMKELFQLTDEVTRKILPSVYIKLTGREEAQLGRRRDPKNLEAQLKAFEVIAAMRGLNPKDNAQAKRLAEELTNMDPDWSAGFTLLARAHYMDVALGVSSSSKESLAKALELAQKAVAMDEFNPTNYDTLGYVLSLMGKHEEALVEFEKGSTLCPSCSDPYMYIGYARYCLDETDKAITSLQTALRLNPYPPPYYYLHMGNAYRHAAKYEEAIPWFKKALQISPNAQMGHVGLVSSYSLLGREEEARSAAQELLRVNPKFAVEVWAKTTPYKNREKLARFADALRKAGLTDKPPLPLPDKPSIAVLPFVNMSDDPKQEFFSDGLSEEIITALSKTPKLFVIARNSSFTYKGKAVDIKQVGRELGVKYVLEGSVRRSGDQIRITAQLIDATTGNHLWAERYDRELKEIFSIQDEITMKIASALQVKLTEGEWASILAKGTESLEAYLKILEGQELIDALNRDDNALARKKCEEAIALDPKSAVAYAFLGFTYVMDFAFGIEREESMKKAFAYTQKALSLDDSQPVVYTTMEFMYGFMRRHEEAIASGEKAVRIAPGSAYAQFSLGRALNFACRDKEALSHLEKAVRMNPIPPAYYHMHIGSAHLNLRNYEEAVSALKKALALTPRNDFARACLMVAYVEMGRMEEARAELQEYRKTNPRPAPPEEFKKRAPWKDEKVTERFIEAFEKLRS